MVRTVKCRVCSHSKRAELETAASSGASSSELASRYGLSQSAVEKHLATHPRAADVKPAKAKTTSKHTKGRTAPRASSARASSTATARRKPP